MHDMVFEIKIPREVAITATVDLGTSHKTDSVTVSSSTHTRQVHCGRNYCGRIPHIIRACSVAEQVLISIRSDNLRLTEFKKS